MVWLWPVAARPPSLGMRRDHHARTTHPKHFPMECDGEVCVVVFSSVAVFPCASGAPLYRRYFLKG
jgi:hypothetical protein